METIYNQREKMTDFIRDNKQNFQDKLLSEAVNVATKINDILEKGNIDLLKNAQKLSLYVVEQKEEQLVAFAQQEGIAWAEHALTLAFKLEWVQAIRRTLWHFLYQYDRMNNHFDGREEFYALEKRINDRIDQFLNTFLISYSKYKDELIASQRDLVENLSVPIIPLSQSVAVLPLIGMIDIHRIQTIEEKVLMGISDLKIETLIIDLSGIANMEMHVVDHFQKILTGISIMGCKAIITGLRADLVRTMIHSGISFKDKAAAKGTLQQTLKEYLEQNRL